MITKSYAKFVENKGLILVVSIVMTCTILFVSRRKMRKGNLIPKKGELFAQNIKLR